MSSRTLQQAIDAGVTVTSEEAVAIVQELIASAAHNDESDESPVAAVPMVDDIHIQSDGSVRSLRTPACLTVRGAGELLDAILPKGEGARVPGPIRYIVARALGQVDAPSFESIAALSAALSRHEHRDRAAVLHDLCARALCPAEMAHDDRGNRPSVVVTFEPTPASPRLVTTRSPLASGRRERRQTAPSVDTLRRQLREVEGELYRTRIQMHADRAVSSDAAVQSELPVSSEPESGRHIMRRVIAVLAALILSFLVGYAAGQAWGSQRAVERVGAPTVSETSRWSVAEAAPASLHLQAADSSGCHECPHTRQ